MKIKEMSRKKGKMLSSEIYDAELKRLRKESEKMCKGMFEFLDAQGGWFEFNYRFFPGESIKTIRLIHGEICELPMGIVKHLNNTIKKIRNYDMNPQSAVDIGSGQKIRMPQQYTKVSRLRFTPMDFL